MKIKGKVYRTVVRPALTDVRGRDIWALKKAQEMKLEVAEMRMLRRMCGVPTLDKIRNEQNKRDNENGGNNKESTGKNVEVVYGHVMRGEENYIRRNEL